MDRSVLKTAAKKGYIKVLIKELEILDNFEN